MNARFINGIIRCTVFFLIGMMLFSMGLRKSGTDMVLWLVLGLFSVLYAGTLAYVLFLRWK